MRPLTLLRSFFLPSRCIICDKVTEKDVTLCPDCEKYVFHPQQKGAKCGVCFMPKDKCACGKRLFYDKLSAPFFRNDTTKRSVYAMKFSMRLDKVPVFADYMLAALEERGLKQDIDLIGFIPMHPKDEFRRSYNQAERLAQSIADKSGIPCEKLLYKYSRNEPQHSFSAALRRRGNVLGIFEPEKNAEEILRGKTVLLVDDILTSGNTINEAAKTLKIFGADRVYCTSVILSEKKKKVDFRKEI